MSIEFGHPLFVYAKLESAFLIPVNLKSKLVFEFTDFKHLGHKYYNQRKKVKKNHFFFTVNFYLIWIVIEITSYR